jgi:hypothetical protein
MATPDRHRLRHKGIETGPLGRDAILGQLREGKLSLIHAVEVHGTWVTLRQYLAELAATNPIPPPGAARKGGASPFPDHGDMPPPPPGAPKAARTLDKTIQLGYVWCGLTFGLPFLLAGPPWYFRSQLGLTGAAGTFVLVVVALAGAGYALSRAGSLASEVESEGLGDVATSLRQLAGGLAAASALLWILAATLA